MRARLDNPATNWKLRLSDLEEREHWDDDQDAHEEMRRRTAAKQAPWVVVLANRRWYRDLVISQTLMDTLEGLDLHYHTPVEDLSGIVVD